MGIQLNVDVGFVAGRLTVLKKAKNKGQNTAWLCRCECGKTTTVRTIYLANGRTKSCGCLLKLNGRFNRTHGEGNSRGNQTVEYRAWQGAKTRCYNQKQKDYKNYGGRGITMCDHWRHSFENFLADMGRCPNGRTLDRYPNNDGNYEPSNCRWATRKEQRANQRPAKCRKSHETVPFT